LQHRYHQTIHYLTKQHFSNLPKLCFKRADLKQSSRGVISKIITPFRHGYQTVQPPFLEPTSNGYEDERLQAQLLLNGQYLKIIATLPEEDLHLTRFTASARPYPKICPTIPNLRNPIPLHHQLTPTHLTATATKKVSRPHFGGHYDKTTLTAATPQKPASTSAGSIGPPSHTSSVRTSGTA
jgi:hypothetical protein